MKGHLPLNGTSGNEEFDDEGYDSDLERDEAKWFALHVRTACSFYLWESTDVTFI
jgi:hypothetical protein